MHHILTLRHQNNMKNYNCISGVQSVTIPIYYARKSDPAVVRGKVDNWCMCRSEGVNDRLMRVIKKAETCVSISSKTLAGNSYQKLWTFLFQFFSSLKTQALITEILIQSSYNHRERVRIPCILSAPISVFSGGQILPVLKPSGSHTTTTMQGSVPH